MPEMIPLGWFHTIMGVIALVSGAVTLAKFKEISLSARSGQVYLAATLVTAVTALAIFQRGEFGPGHALAIVTLLALGIGLLAELKISFGRLSRYIQAVAYTTTLLCHCIPAVTDGLMRLPVGDPVVTSLGDPLLRLCYLVLLLVFLTGLILQLLWIRNNPEKQVSQ